MNSSFGCSSRPTALRDSIVAADSKHDLRTHITACNDAILNVHAWVVQRTPPYQSMTRACRSSLGTIK